MIWCDRLEVSRLDHEKVENRKGADCAKPSRPHFCCARDCSTNPPGQPREKNAETKWHQGDVESRNFETEKSTGGNIDACALRKQPDVGGGSEGNQKIGLRVVFEEPKNCEWNRERAETDGNRN